MVKIFRIKIGFLLIFLLITFGCSGIENTIYSYYSKIDGPDTPITPYLIYEGDNTSIKVMWETDTDQQSHLQWGEDIFCSSGTFIDPASNSEQHEYTISNLTPGKKYFYQISFSGRTLKGSFYTAPEKTATRTKLFVFGDTRKYTQIHDSIAGSMIAAYTADPEYQTIALMTGDIVNNGNKRSSWENEIFAERYGNLIRFQAEIPRLIVRGNHEGNGKLFKSLFPYAFVQNCYWSFDYGPVHVLMLDQYEKDVGKISATQKEWIRNDLATSKKPWKLIMSHEPGWSAGIDQNINVQQDLQPIAREHNALVISGHNHYYARAVIDGVTHITTGGGGAPLQIPDAGYPKILISDQSHHFCTIEIDGNILVFSALRLDGSLIDRFTLTRKPS